MLSLYELKPQFQAALRPLAQKCAGHGITANYMGRYGIICFGRWIFNVIFQNSVVVLVVAIDFFGANGA